MFLTKRNLNKEESASEKNIQNVSPKAAFRNTLGKQERIKSTKLIDGLFNNGSSFFLPPLRVIYKYESWEEAVTCKVAFVVPKRNFKKAVDRNRIKRLLRETYRTNKGPLYSFLKGQNKQLAIVLAYSHNKLPDYSSLNLLMQQALNKLIAKQ